MADFEFHLPEDISLPTAYEARHAIFSECPHCGGEMKPEHAHYRCSECGFRDSCCD